MPCQVTSWPDCYPDGKHKVSGTRLVIDSPVLNLPFYDSGFDGLDTFYRRKVIHLVHKLWRKAGALEAQTLLTPRRFSKPR